MVSRVRRQFAVASLVLLAGSTFVATPAVADEFDAICTRAAELTEAGYPAQAIELIEEARGYDTASKLASPESTTPTIAEVCQQQLLAALSLTYAPGVSIAATCAAAASLIEERRYAEAIAVIEAARNSARDRLSSGDVVIPTPTNSPPGSYSTSIREPSPGESAAYICGKELSAAKEGLAAEFGNLGRAWGQFRTANVDPIVPALTICLLVSLSLVLLTRLLQSVPFLRDRTTSKWKRRVLGTLGLSGILLAPVAAVASAGATCSGGDTNGCANGPMSWSAVTYGFLWIAVGVVAAFALAYAFGSRLRLVLHGPVGIDGEVVEDEDVGEDEVEGPKPSIASADKAATRKAQNGVGRAPIPLLASLRKIGGAPIRGVEVPTGSDVTALTPLISELPNSKTLQWVVKAWDLLVNASPWKVSITPLDADNEAVSLSIERNGHAIAQEVLRVRDVTNLVRDDAFDATQRSKVLASLAAAYVLWTLAERYPAELSPGLYGATRWESLAYHYIATTELGYDRRAEAISLLEEAVMLDRSNGLATTALWLYLYRDSRRIEDLRSYRDWLQRRLLSSPDGRSELRIRQSMTYWALTRNLRALGHGMDLYEDAELTIRSQLRQLLEERRVDQSAEALYQTWRQLWSIDLVRLFGPAAFIDSESEWWISAQHSGDAVVAYSLACNRARQIAIEAGGGPIPESSRGDVRRLLGIALVEPALAAWAPRDPELDGFVPADGVFNPTTQLVLHEEDFENASEEAKELAALVSGGEDLDGYGLTALYLLNTDQRASSNWLRVNRKSPEGARQAQTIFHVLRDQYGYNGTPTDVLDWMDKLSQAPATQ